MLPNDAAAFQLIFLPLLLLFQRLLELVVLVVDPVSLAVVIVVEQVSLMPVLA